MKRFKIGFFPGTFDLLHNGHIRAVKEARSKCDRLVIGININPNKQEPILTYAERKELLVALRDVDGIVGYENDKELYELDKKPFYNIRFVGADHKKLHHKINAKVIKISRNHDYSTSNLRKRIYEREKNNCR